MALTNITPQGGTDKHRALAYLEITDKNNQTRRFYAYTRVTFAASVDTRDNTNPNSPVGQIQRMRRETPSFDIEVNIPFDNTQAKDSINFLRAGKVLDNFDIYNQDPGDAVGEPVFQDGYLQQFGSYIIERSTIDISRDDFTTIRATVRALGYTRARQLQPQVVPV